MDKAFNTVFELDKHAKACDAGNRSIKFLSYIGQHILRHLEFIRFPFCLNGKAFPCRGMACHEGKLIVQVFLFLLGKFLPRPLLLEETMDQQIWIAPDGRGKMRVVLGSKAKVAHIFRLDTACFMLRRARVEIMPSSGFPFTLRRAIEEL